VNIQIVDPNGALLAQGRSLEELRERFAESARKQVQGSGAQQFEQRQIQQFPEKIEIPAQRTIESGSVVAYPALVDQQTSVDIRLLSSPTEQLEANRTGYARLAWLQLGGVARYFRKEIKGRKDLGLYFASLGDAAALTDQVMLGIAWYCFFEERPLPQTKDAFNERLEALRPDLAEVFASTLDALEETLKLRFDLVRLLEDNTSPAYKPAIADLREQIARLVPSDVLKRTPSRYLKDVPWYLAAATYRFQNLQGKINKDTQNTELIRNLESRWQALASHAAVDSQVLESIRYELEEVRVGLFAEPLARRGQATAKKVEKKVIENERRAGLR
jgi:ATP-dependent helicase HrpA